MRQSLGLALLAGFAFPRPALAGNCIGPVVNGVATSVPCPDKIDTSGLNGPNAPAPNLQLPGNNPDATLHELGQLTNIPNGTLPPSGVMGQIVAPTTQHGQGTILPDGSKGATGDNRNAVPTPGNGTPNNGAAIVGKPGNVPNAVTPTATANAGASQERLALGSTGAAANGLSTSAGDKYIAANRPLDADRNFQRVRANDPDNTAALAGHAQALSALGQKSEAVAAAKHLLALDPANPIAKGIVAEDHAEGVTSKFKKLTDSFLHGPTGENLPDRQPGQDFAGGGAAAGAQPQVRTAEAPLTGVPAGGGDTTLTFGPLLQKAMRKLAVGDFTGALVDVSQELDSNPKNAAAWTLRAELDLQLSNYPAGITDSTRALDLTPDNARALRARSYGEYETQLYRQALADSMRAVALDPKSGLGFLYKAMAEDKLGLADAASSDLSQALALDPTLKRLAAPLLHKFNLGGDAAGSTAFRLKPWMLRGGFVGLAMLLVFVGLLGTQKAKTMRGIQLTPRRSQTDAPAALVELAPGSVLSGGYRILREIGRGGMGVVYEGMDETLQRRVAVKRLLQDELTLPEDRDRFLREARLVAQLKHPNLAQIYAVTGEREPFLVFEYVEGETLDGVLSRSVKLPTADARRIVAEIAGALSYAHGHNIIHRDLKPSNVMIATNGTTKVMDFGIAHQSRSAATQMTQTIACGTPPYMAPEQGLGSVSKASDLYALGVMTYELLTGQRPFQGPNYLDQKLQKVYAPATTLNPTLPAAIDHFFATALDPDPTKRPASASAFMEAFGRACDATPRRQASAA